MYHNKYLNVIGVDVASQKLDIHDLQTGDHLVIDRSPAATTKFVEQLRTRQQPILVVMEATGGYEAPLIDALHDAHIDCCVVNPLRIRQFARACGKLEKNDRIDARVIAEFGAVVEPVLKEALSPERRRLRNFVHRREQLLSLCSAERNRLEQADDPHVRKLIESSLKFYATQIRKVDKIIAATIRECQELAEPAAILNSCPGVGAATVGTLLSELPELGQLNRGQIAKLAGVAPIARDSGQKTGQRSTGAGRALIRKTVYMAALVSTRYNPPLKAFYQALLKRGKPKKLALVAVMRKLLITLNTMIKNKQFWREPSLAIDFS